ncbi:hypothetical protein AOQ84DRAFT_414557 [Glonium stellatum]|uniref:Uncharacterized protein n=1 Tax=Glonium stellatum TaxID=574774 RepID=A0A8E2EUQ8_9PEZI|nr:hypothetical protein AOQ84DRAFT_414557 [Glonium stellatum]
MDSAMAGQGLALRASESPLSRLSLEHLSRQSEGQLLLPHERLSAGRPRSGRPHTGRPAADQSPLSWHTPTPAETDKAPLAGRPSCRPMGSPRRHLSAKPPPAWTSSDLRLALVQCAKPLRRPVLTTGARALAHLIMPSRSRSTARAQRISTAAPAPIYPRLSQKSLKPGHRAERLAQAFITLACMVERVACSPLLQRQWSRSPCATLSLALSVRPTAIVILALLVG